MEALDALQPGILLVSLIYAVLGMIFFGEILRPYHGVGTILVLAGVIMVSRAYAAPPPVKTT